MKESLDVLEMVRPRTRLLNGPGAAHPGGLNKPFLCCWACGVETTDVYVREACSGHELRAVETE